MNALRPVLVASVAVALFCGLNPPAVGQVEPGRVTTRSFEPLPQPIVLTVAPDDNSDANVALARQVTTELARRGYKVGASAPSGASAPGFVLRFDTETRANVEAEHPRFNREASSDPSDGLSIGIAGPPDQPNEVGTLFSSRPGRGVIAPPPDRRYDRALRHVLNMRLEDQRTGAILWEGHAQYDTYQSDADPFLAALAPLLIEEIGRTVRERRVTLKQ
jgi:hypothetical protein